MPRGPREVEADWPYHLVVRGNNRRRLFSYPRDYERFLWFLRDAHRHGRCPIHSLSLMSNHVHLMVRPRTEKALARLMKPTLQNYAQWRNRKRAASGKLFEQRFYSKRIENDRHFGRCQAYIETNPDRAGIHVDEYRWSTLGLFTGRGSRELRRRFDFVEPSSWYLELAATRERREAEYRSWVELTLAGVIAPAHIADIVRLESPPMGGIFRPDGSPAW